MGEYNDEFLTVFIDKDNNRGGYADRFCHGAYFSMDVAEFLIKKLKDNWEHGYHLLDLVLEKGVRI